MNTVNLTKSRMKSLLYRVFGWMSAGLTVTGITASFVAYTPLLRETFLGNPAIAIMLLVAQVAVVFSLSFMIFRISYETALSLFLLYSFLTGITLSAVFLAYTTASIALTFFVAAGMFCAMAIYGAVTDADLSSFGNILFMGLIGLIIAMVINAFVQSSQFELLISILGVIIFCGLTAYDVQNAQRIAARVQEEHSQSMEGNIAIFLALSLYLNFINLFLYLLRIMGERRR